MTPAAIALPMMVDANSPSNTSGNRVTSSNVMRGRSVSGVVVIVQAVDSNLHFTAGRVDSDDEVGDQGDQELATVVVDHGRNVVRAVPQRAAYAAQRTAM